MLPLLERQNGRFYIVCGEHHSPGFDWCMIVFIVIQKRKQYQNGTGIIK